MQDLRIWMYREGEGRIFESRDHVPPNEGWVDSPAKVKHEDRNGKETEGDAEAQERQGQGHGIREEGQQEGLLNFDGLSKEALFDIADKAGVQIDKRWGRARIEQALRDAE